ncbi:ABC transporter permease [Micromonospora sp. M12]
MGSTTALSVVERVRESGLLRAIGLSRTGLRTMLTVESGLYGVIGATIGLVLGIPYAWLAVQALGIDAPLTAPLLPLAGLFVTLVVLTALAGCCRPGGRRGSARWWRWGRRLTRATGRRWSAAPTRGGTVSWGCWRGSASPRRRRGCCCRPVAVAA